MSQPRCHKNPSAGFSSTALLYASGHSCPHASPFMTGFVSQPPAASTGIQFLPESSLHIVCTQVCVLRGIHQHLANSWHPSVGTTYQSMCPDYS